MSGKNATPNKLPPVRQGRPTDEEIARRGYTRKQLKTLAKRWHERQNPRLF